MKKYILDASVILTYLIGKNNIVRIEFNKILKSQKQNKAKFFSTHLLPKEIGNGLRYSISNQKLAKEILEKSLNLPVTYFELKPEHYQKILELSYKLQTSFYDTSYHFLAILLKATFLTCDKRYFQKAKQLKHITLL